MQCRKIDKHVLKGYYVSTVVLKSANSLEDPTAKSGGDPFTD